MAKHIFHIALLLCAAIFKGYSQNTIITGNVKDAESGEPLPFVNISMKGTKYGTITDIDGNFSLNVSLHGDTLIVSYLGYKTEKLAVKKGQKQHFDINMKMVGIQLGEVVVMPGKNPEDILLNLIHERKKINKPKSLDYYSYDVYNKLEFDLNNISRDFGSNKLTQSFEFLKDYVDTADVSNKSFIPFFISESFSSIYYRKQPQKELEIVKANKISGINNESLKRFTGDIYQDVDIYENVITVLGKGFISPLGNMGKAYYDYQLTDTSYHDNRWCYRLEFKPKRKHEPTIEGYVYINDTTFAVKGFEVSLSETANINFVDSLVAEKHYVQIEDSIWLIKKDRIFVDFNLVDTREGFFGRKTSYYSNHKINEKVDKSVFEKSYPSNLIYTDSVVTTNKAFWEEKRPKKLSKREAEIYDMVDTIKTVKAFKRWETILTTIVSGYYAVGPIDFGPIYSYISTNPVEGTRLRLGFKTNQDFSPKLKLEGFGAYGFGDKEWKYGGGFTYMFDVLPRRAIHFYAAHDYLQMGDQLNALRTDNVLGTLLRRPGDINMYRTTTWDIHYEHEFIEGISLFAGMETNTILARPNHDFQIQPANAPDNSPVYQTKEQLQSTKFNIGLHLAPGEKFVRGKFNRISLGTKKPVINLNLGYAPSNYFSNQYEYLSVSLNYKHKIQLYPVGVLHYALEGGKVFGTTPFPFLFVHKGNQSFAYYDYTFNLMNFYEFVSDTYMSIYAEHRFEGFFLSHIPLIRKLEWREHIGFKTTYGQINEDNKEVIVFPPHTHDFRTFDDSRELPYVEVNAGISNILKILRIDAVWRLSHLNNPDIPDIPDIHIYPFAVMAKLKIDF
ncbi:MAG: DUF5686 family protein [Bacteroidales bacterium]